MHCIRAPFRSEAYELNKVFWQIVLSLSEESVEDEFFFRAFYSNETNGKFSSLYAKAIF